MSYVTLILLVSASALSADGPTPKAAIPAEAAQKATLAIVADAYKPDYEKAKTPAQKIELAKKLLQEGEATKDDPTGRFVLFRVARDIAAQQGDLATAFAAIGRIADEFEADALQMRVEAATQAVKANKTPKDHLGCVTLLLPLIDEAIAADRYRPSKPADSFPLAFAAISGETCCAKVSYGGRLAQKCPT